MKEWGNPDDVLQIHKISEMPLGDERRGKKRLSSPSFKTENNNEIVMVVK